MTNSSALGETYEEPAGSVSYKIIQRITAITEEEAAQLPPLYNSIDPDALDRLVQSAETGTTSLKIQFTYAEHQVTVDANGTISCSRCSSD